MMKPSSLLLPVCLAAVSTAFAVEPSPAPTESPTAGVKAETTEPVAPTTPEVDPVPTADSAETTLPAEPAVLFDPNDPNHSILPTEETVSTSVTSASHKGGAKPAPSPSASPSLEAAAQDLYESGIEAFGAQRYSAAIERFERLLREHPSSTYRLEGLFALGHSYFQAKKFAEAINPLQATIEIAGGSPLASEARVLLGTSYLELGKNSEAFLVSEELLRQKGLRSTLRGKALLIRAQAQVGLKQPLEAEKSFTIFQAIADQDPELERELARSYLVSLIVKSSECDTLPSAAALPEDQLIDQLNRKGVCLLEMGALLSRSARALSSAELKDGSDLVLKSYRSYSNHCQNPPLTQGSRTEQEWKTARTELKQKLKESCQSTFQLLMESLKERESAADLQNSLKNP